VTPLTALEGFTLASAVFGAYAVPIGISLYIERIKGRQERHEAECLIIRKAQDQRLDLIVERLNDRDAAVLQQIDRRHDAIMLSLQAIRQEVIARRAAS
jgi:hypothetical protein